MDMEKGLTNNSISSVAQSNKRSHTTAAQSIMSVKSGSANSQSKMENLKTSGS